jgi:magnesium chelatase subunit I
VRTHYPIDLDDELRLIRQEAVVGWGVDAVSAMLPDHLIEIVARFARHVRESPAVDQRSGVSARFAVAAAETVAASAVRRSALTNEQPAVSRVADLPSIVPAVQGKVEFEASEEGREAEILDHLLRRSVADTFRARLGGVDLSALVDRFADGSVVETGELVPAVEVLDSLGPIEGLAKLLAAAGIDDVDTPALAAAGVEFALEGLYLLRRLSKESVDDRVLYGSR